MILMLEPKQPTKVKYSENQIAIDNMMQTINNNDTK